MKKSNIMCEMHGGLGVLTIEGKLSDNLHKHDGDDTLWGTCDKCKELDEWCHLYNNGQEVMEYLPCYRIRVYHNHD